MIRIPALIFFLICTCSISPAKATATDAEKAVPAVETTSSAPPAPPDAVDPPTSNSDSPNETEMPAQKEAIPGDTPNPETSPAQIDRGSAAAAPTPGTPGQQSQVEPTLKNSFELKKDEGTLELIDMGLGIQTVLVSDKLTMGAYGSVFFNKYLGASISAMLLWATEPTDRIDSSFIGGILNFQAVVRFLSFKYFEADAGLAYEMWALAAIHEEEIKSAMVVSLEPALIFGQVRLGYEVRYYPLVSAGLGVGETFDGDKSFVLVSSINLGWRFS